MPVLPGRKTAIAVLLAGSCLGGSAVADDPARIEVTIKDHVFSPAEIHVPTGKPTVLIVRNEDAGPEEFELHGAQGGEGDRRRHLRHDPAAAAGTGALSVHGRVPPRHRARRCNLAVKSVKRGAGQTLSLTRYVFMIDRTIH